MHKEFKNTYIIAILIMVAAALASTALSQPPWEERLGGFDQQSISAGDNMLPTITALESNKASPQDAGTAIRWKAKAEDPEGDTISTSSC